MEVARSVSRPLQQTREEAMSALTWQQQGGRETEEIKGIKDQPWVGAAGTNP